MSKPRLSVIAAVAEGNRAIGKDNRLLWHIPDDLKRFKTLTLGHPVIMGENTYRSIGRPLPGRTNIILSFSKQFSAPGCEVFATLESALNYAAKRDAKEVFIIGGAMVYQAALPLADRLYITLVEGDYQGDAFFPDYSMFGTVVGREHHDDGQHRFTFLTLER